MNKLKINHKLGLAALFFIVPVLYLLYALVSLQNVSINFAQLEAQGVQYLRQVQSVLLQWPDTSWGWGRPR